MVFCALFVQWSILATILIFTLSLPLSHVFSAQSILLYSQPQCSFVSYTHVNRDYLVFPDLGQFFVGGSPRLPPISAHPTPFKAPRKDPIPSPVLTKFITLWFWNIFILFLQIGGSNCHGFGGVRKKIKITIFLVWLQILRGSKYWTPKNHKYLNRGLFFTQLLNGIQTPSQ